MTTVNTRLLVCQLVAGKKDKLWGKLSNTLTNKEKMALWEQIRQEAIAGGATSLTGRDGAYVRDSIWGGARRDAMKKRDIADVSGKGAVNFTQVDNLVLEIVGRDTPAVAGMGVRDSEENMVGDEELEALAKKAEDKEVKGEIKPAIDSGITPLRKGFTKPGSHRSSPMLFADSDLDVAIKKAKLQLLNEQIEGQRISNERAREELIRSRHSSAGYLGMPSGISPRPSSVFTPIQHAEDASKFGPGEGQTSKEFNPEDY